VAATYHRKITDIFWVVAGKTARAAFWSAPAKKWVEMPTLAEGQDAEFHGPLPELDPAGQREGRRRGPRREREGARLERPART